MTAKWGDMPWRGCSWSRRRPEDYSPLARNVIAVFIQAEGKVALCTVTLDGDVMTYGVALTSDIQLVSLPR